MKKVLAILLLVILLAPVLAGCGFNLHFGDFEISGPGSRFDVNDSAELDMDGVDTIRMSSVSDDIIVKSGGSKVVAELKGECYASSKPVWLDAHKDGDTIVIDVKYPNFISSNTTVLTVTIPSEYAGDLRANAVSGDVDAVGLPFRLGKVELGTVSGEIAFDCDSYEEIKATTISGGVSISGIKARTEAHTTSGDIHLDYDAFAETTAGSVSGGVEAAIPQGDAFSVDFGSVSGSFTSTHAGITVDRADRGFDGSANGGGLLFKVNTTSGDLKISGK